MTRTFLISDTHFSHHGVCKFLRSDGTKLRPWDNVYEMDEALVKNWNSVVSPQDKVYHLGDVLINNSAFPILHRLNGRKILIKGNHDIFKIQKYLEYFDDVRAYWPLDDIILSHVPIHPDSLSRWKYNVHGHLHANRVLDTHKKIDPRYFCISVEQINYTPISFDELKKKLNYE